MTITPEEVAKLAAAATPGSWQWGEYTADGIAGVLEPYMCQGEGFVEVSEPDAAFIAAAHDMADLIAKQDRLLKLADDMANSPTAEDEDALAAVVAYRTARNTEEEDQ